MDCSVVARHSCNGSDKVPQRMDLLCDLLEELIPGLPNDVAFQCLLRIPVQAHPQLQRVSRKWRELVNSPQYYEERKREGTTMHFLCTLQALSHQSPDLKHNSSSSPAENSSSSPVFGISVFNAKDRTTWERLPHIPDHPNGLPLFCRLVAVSGNLLVMGGWNPATWETLRSVYLYNFSSRTWRRGADMPSDRSFFACVALEGYVVVAGGHDTTKSALATAEVYSVEKDEWKTLPKMSEERDECTGVTLDGKIYVISGYSTESQGQFVKSADIYDPVRRTWTRIENMLAMATDSSTTSGIFTVLSGTLYTLQDHKTLLSYSTTKNSWSSVATLEHQMFSSQGCCLAAVQDSLVLLTTASASSNNNEEDHPAYKTFVYKPAALVQQETVTAAAGSRSRRSINNTSCAWEEVQSNDGFVGAAQFACAVEV